LKSGRRSRATAVRGNATRLRTSCPSRCLTRRPLSSTSGTR
jgi:hypothetical protein